MRLVVFRPETVVCMAPSARVYMCYLGRRDPVHAMVVPIKVVISWRKKNILNVLAAC